jgi:2-keto-4-pentenoate hydratase/2-oxohepta-3-ene-1,7-dioic acid hydratase in catechol pathway
MKIARYEDGRIGVVIGNTITDISSITGLDTASWPPVSTVQLIQKFDVLRPIIEEKLPTLSSQPLDQVRLSTPVPWPNKIVAYPVNYHDHGKEMQAGYRATNQGFFLKPNSSLCGPNDVVELPNVPGREVHHECELGIIIGRHARGINKSDWRSYVFGYVCLMDMVVRGREERVFRKAYDTFCPVGPWITTADEVSNPEELEMKLWVNGELRQHANTRDLVLDIPGMLKTAADVMTLYPGDIIATGTPAGVGPIIDGDNVRIAIQDLGEMTLKVKQGLLGGTEVFAQPYVPPIIKQN